MPSTYTTRIRLEKQATGENSNTWGSRLNSNVFSLVDQAVAGYTSIALAADSVTLSVENGSVDQARSAILELHGTITSSVDVIIPSVTKQYLVRNNTSGAFSVTMKCAGGDGTAVPQGYVAIMYCDGVSVRSAFGTGASRNIGTSVTEIPDISIADARYVQTSSDSTITGSKTFTSVTNFDNIVNVSGVTNFSNIVNVSGAARGTIITLTDAACIAVSSSNANNFVVTLGGNRTLKAMTPAQPGQTGLIYVYQDGTGSRTLAYNSVYKFAGGTAPTLTTTASAVDILSYSVRTSTAIDAELKADFK
jgi:hypothetical protein